MDPPPPPPPPNCDCCGCGENCWCCCCGCHAGCCCCCCCSWLCCAKGDAANARKWPSLLLPPLVPLVDSAPAPPPPPLEDSEDDAADVEASSRVASNATEVEAEEDRLECCLPPLSADVEAALLSTVDVL